MQGSKIFVAAFLALGWSALTLPSALSAEAGKTSDHEWDDRSPTPVRAFRFFDAQRAPGLPQSTVMDLIQDDAGLLWIATLDGLGVFDGTEIRGVDPAPDAPVYGSLYALARRGAGGIWVGGASQVWSWDGETWHVYAAPGAAASLAEDGLGRLWRVDQSGGLWRFDPSRLDPVSASLTAGDSASGTASGAASGTASGTASGDASAAYLAAGPWIRVPTPSWLGPAVATQSPVRPRSDDRATVDVHTGPKLWLAGQRGVGMLLSDTGFQPVSGGSPTAGETDVSITALLTASDGTVWVASSGGALHHTVAGGWRRVQVPDWDGGHVRSLAEDRRGRIWAGGLAGGLAFGRAGETWTTWGGGNGLRPEGILSLLADREGTLWISANGYGLVQWIGEAWSHRNTWPGDRGDARQPVFGITPALGDGPGGKPGGAFYAAAFARGVWHWDGRRLHAYGEDDGITENVRSVFEPEPGVLWVSARFGIYERTSPGRPFRFMTRVPSGFVYGVQRAPNGDFWAHTSAHGVLVRDAEGSDWRLYEEINRDLPDRDVKAIYFAADKAVWLGTLSGLVVVNDGRVQTLPTEAVAALPRAVQAIHEDPNGDVWVAGFGGVSRVPAGDLTSAIETLTQDDGLPSHTIYSLASTTAPAGDGGASELWLGGSDGLGRLDLSDATRTIRVYDATDGLTEDECNHMGLLPAPDGSLYVGTMASLARFDPAIESVSRAPLRVEWLDRPDDGAELPARRRAVPLRWHAPWLAPQPVEYRTRVPRLGDEWSEPTSRPSLDLKNLGPGTWRVEVSARLAGRAEDRGGAWTEPIATRFHIQPLFRETTGFLALCALLLASLVFAFVRWRTARLRRRAAELQAAVDEALARIKVLGGLIPICAGCKKVRGDEGYWQQIESYLHVHSEAELSHGLCPDCASEMYGAYLQPEMEAADEAAREADRATLS